MGVTTDIPLKKAVAGVRVGLLPELGFVVNPSVQQMESSSLDLVMGGTADAVLMIEGFCDFLTEEQMLQVRHPPPCCCTSMVALFWTGNILSNDLCTGAKQAGRNSTMV